MHVPLVQGPEGRGRAAELLHHEVLEAGEGQGASLTLS